MNALELKKKSRNSNAGLKRKALQNNKLKTLLKTARSYGLPGNDTHPQTLTGFMLTTYENMAIALGHAVVAMQCLDRLTSKPTPILLMPSTVQVIELNLREVICCLHDSLGNSNNKKESR